MSNATTTFHYARHEAIAVTAADAAPYWGLDSDNIVIEVYRYAPEDTTASDGYAYADSIVIEAASGIGDCDDMDRTLAAHGWATTGGGWVPDGIEFRASVARTRAASGA